MSKPKSIEVSTAGHANLDGYGDVAKACDKRSLELGLSVPSFFGNGKKAKHKKQKIIYGTHH